MIFASHSVTTTLLAVLASTTAASQHGNLLHWSREKQSTPGTNVAVDQPRPLLHWNYKKQLTASQSTAAAGSCHAGSDIHYQSVVHSTQLFFRPSNGTSVMYPRVVELQDGTILATVAYNRRNATGKPHFPIFASCDGGNTWSWRGNVTDQVDRPGLSAQPALAELPWDLGNFKKGTILAAGLGSNNRTGSVIDLYASEDKGTSWKFVSNVAQSRRGGLFEPFIL